jgi:PAS domain S-box-containing protein
VSGVSVDLSGMVLQSAPVAIVGETLDGTVVAWNRAAEQLYGYAAAEMIGQSASRLCPPDSPRLGEFVGERIRRDGARIRVCVRAAPILDGSGATAGISTTSWAVHDNRIGHELRTPLNAIIGFTGTLLMGLAGPLNEEQTHQLGLVRASADELLARINQLPQGCP